MPYLTKPTTATTQLLDHPMDALRMLGMKTDHKSFQQFVDDTYWNDRKTITRARDHYGVKVLVHAKWSDTLDRYIVTIEPI